MNIPYSILNQISIKSHSQDPNLKVELNRTAPCEDCGIEQLNRGTRIIWQNWRTKPLWYETCWSCKLVRIPGVTEFMPRPELDKLLKR